MLGINTRLSSLCVCVCAVKIYILFTNETSFVWRCKGEKQKHNSIPTTVTETLQREPKRERESEWGKEEYNEEEHENEINEMVIKRNNL